jgi:hypothetical protein
MIAFCVRFFLAFFGGGGGISINFANASSPSSLQHEKQNLWMIITFWVGFRPSELNVCDCNRLDTEFCSLLIDCLNDRWIWPTASKEMRCRHCQCKGFSLFIG